MWQETAALRDFDRTYVGSGSDSAARDVRDMSVLPSISAVMIAEPRSAEPPGRAMLSTKPAPIGSITAAKTIGTLPVAFCNAATVGLAEAKLTSAPSATSSAA